MKSVVIPFVVPFLLAGLAWNAAGGDSPPKLIRVEQVTLHLAKGGGGHVEVTSLWDDVPALSQEHKLDATKYALLAEYGVKNCKSHGTVINERKCRIVSRGDVTDILQFVRILDSGVPFTLSQSKSFEMAWDGARFRLHMKYRRGDVTESKPTQDPTMVVMTDGRFMRWDGGQVSNDRSKVAFTSGQKEVRLEIEGLGVK